MKQSYWDISERDLNIVRALFDKAKENDSEICVHKVAEAIRYTNAEMTPEELMAYAHYLLRDRLMRNKYVIRTEKIICKWCPKHHYSYRKNGYIRTAKKINKREAYKKRIETFSAPINKTYVGTTEKTELTEKPVSVYITIGDVKIEIRR